MKLMSSQTGMRVTAVVDANTMPKALPLKYWCQCHISLASASEVASYPRVA